MRNEISEKNKYWISKRRYLELKNFCLQYYEWKDMINYIDSQKYSNDIVKACANRINTNDPTALVAMLRLEFSMKIEMVEAAAKKTDDYLKDYILEAVTKGLSYNDLKMQKDIPAGKDLYYDRYRKFFYILDAIRK